MAHARPYAPARRESLSAEALSQPASVPQPDTDRTSQRYLLGIVLLAVVLRLFRLGQNSLWVDELASLNVALQPLGQIPAAALQGNAFEPPLYFWLLHGVIALLGTSEAALRAISVVAGILTIPFTWLLVRDLTGRTVPANLVALLLAVNPLHIWYSQEARPYALMLLFAVTSLYCLRLAVRSGRLALWLGYAILSALTVLTHVTAIVIPAIGAFWVIWSDRRMARLLPLAGSSIALLLLLTPFFLQFAATIEPGSTGSPPRPLTGLEGPYSLFTYVAGYSFGPSIRELQHDGALRAIRQNLAQTIVAGVTLATIGILALRRRSDAMVQLAAVVIVPVAAAVLGSVITTKAFSVRYTLPALIGFVGISGLAAIGLEPSARRIYLAGVLLVSGWADAQWFFASKYWKEDSRSALACVAERLRPGARVGIMPAYMAGPLRHYLPEWGPNLSLFVVATADDIATVRPEALLTSRLHHAADAPEVVRAFQVFAGANTVEGHVPGYQIYLRPEQAASSLTCAVRR